MKVLGINSIVLIGSSSYLVKAIAKKGVSFCDSKAKITLFDLASVEENLKTHVMRIERI